MFLCRNEELSKLKKRFENRKFECIVVYGRRRVGKTALINEFCKDKKTIFFSALNSNAADNLKLLSQSIYAAEHPEAATAPVFSDFDAAFEEITRIGEKERIIFVIDEYPYLAKAEESISSRLQHLIDHRWCDSQIFLILCGSSMSFMEYQVLGYESPLYGRRTAQFKLEPLRYKEAAEFYPYLSCEDNACVYGITGGVPHYLNKLDIQGNIDKALVENVFDTSSYLYEEPGNLLKQELREPAVYNAIITAVADGASKLNEIAQKAGIESGPCTKYLKVLMDLGIIKKETPITEKAGKKTLYQIEDCFFRFWYRFVPSNMTSIVSGRMKTNYNKVITPFISDYMGLIFEKMCKDYLLYYDQNLPIEIKDIGQWWGNDKEEKKEIQIDIVAASSDEKEFVIGSCKYRNEKTGIEELKLLKHYAEVFANNKKYHFYIFSKAGFTDALKECERNGEVTLITLEKMYNCEG